MAGDTDGGQQRMPMSELEVTEADRTLGAILYALRVLPLDDLLTAAGTILTLSETRTDKSLQQHTEAELRLLLRRSAETLYRNDPEMLTVVDNFLDAIGRARLKRSLG